MNEKIVTLATLADGAVSLVCQSKLSPMKKVDTVLFIGRSGNRGVAQEQEINQLDAFETNVMQMGGKQ